MRAWHILRSRLHSLFLRGRREADLREELELHLEREAERLAAAGLSAEAARHEALRTFGAVEATKDACRDARGTAVLDALGRDLRHAGRSVRRAPLTALTIVTTVGLGLGLVAAVFTVLNGFVFRVDAVRDPHGIVAVGRQGADEPEAFTLGQYERLVRETDTFAVAFARTPDLDAWMDGRRLEGPLVTGNFFQVLGVAAELGRAFTPADDEPGGPPVVVLSHQAWTRHFARDPGILERTVQVNGAAFAVVGVMPASFRGLSIAPPDYWAPLALLGEFRRGPAGREDASGLEVIGRLRPGLTTGQAVARLNAWDRERAAAAGAPRPTASLVLAPRLGTVPQPAEAVLAVMPLFVAFGLVLVIGCANVANLLLARGVARQREIGIRLSIGASRRRVIAQLLTENAVLALAAAALGLAISRIVLATVAHALTSTFPPDFGDIRFAVAPADWRVVLFLLAGALASTVVFALAPAIQATRIELVRAMRGEVVRDARPGRARNALIALQVTGSVLLLVCAGIFLRSTWAAATVDPGVRTVDVVTLRVLDEPRRQAVLDLVRTTAAVTSVAAAWPGGLGGRAALAHGATGRSAVACQLVSPEHFGILGITLARGRGFGDTERSDTAAVAVVSETVADRLWPGADAVGQEMRIEPDPASAPQPDDPPLVARSVTVVGVARDVPGFRLGGQRLAGAGVYLPADPDLAGTAITLRVRDDAQRVREELANRLAAIGPNTAEVSTLQSLARMEAYLLGIPFWLTLALGAVALALTLSGLVSVLSYLVQQRTREIGVRMAIGATGRGVAALVLGQLLRPVAIGLLLGASLTGALGAAILASPLAAEIGSAVRLFDPVAYAASLLCIVAACVIAALVPAWRATRIDPVSALRQG